MPRFLPYRPEQAYLLPPSVKDELGSEHLCFFVHEVVERMDLRGFEQAYSAEGGELYHPALMLKVWLYGYALGMTSGRRLEQRIREDLGLRFLAGGARPDNWALSAFRRRHARGINDALTQVLELARAAGWRKLGRVAIDSMRMAAAASRHRIETEQRLREERARLRRQVRRWQKACEEDDSNWRRCQDGCSGCANRDKPSCRAPMGKHVFCGRRVGSCWATRRRWPSATIT